MNPRAWIRLELELELELAQQTTDDMVIDCVIVTFCPNSTHDFKGSYMSKIVGMSDSFLNETHSSAIWIDDH